MCTHYRYLYFPNFDRIADWGTVGYDIRSIPCNQHISKSTQRILIKCSSLDWFKNIYVKRAIICLLGTEFECLGHF